MSASYQKSYGVEAYLKFVGKPLVMSMTIDDDDQVFKVELKNFTLKDLITGIVQIVKPGYELSIPTPWSYILEFNIPQFTLLLKAPRDPKSKVEFGIAFNPNFNDFGLKIEKIEVFARSVREVNINMEGYLDIFGLRYDLANLFGKEGVNLLGAEGLPQPAPKPSLFDLKFIGIGQHLQLKKASSYQHVKEVVNDMLDLFDPPAPDTVVPKFSELLRFSNESDWLFGLDVEIMKTVALQVVFNDPVLYGLYLKLSGEKAKVLAGLEFEILYKKVTDDIGVYQIELKLPDAIRSLEFGAVSVTLPIIAVWIYTNGNFKVDFGFPYNNDFSRSFGVQCFPFSGQGGFYFAYLNGATSVTVPKTDLGTFDPVLEFGLGMNIGLGKTFDKGILRAGLSLTFYGILEGCLAWFKPYDNAPVNKQLTDFFYRVKGTFGIIGHIYGAVNFAIISAALDIIVYAQISVQIEACAPILLAFEAGVSLKLTVKINLGLFKVNIALSFSATIRESFTIGHASPAQWNSPKTLRKSIRAKKAIPGLHTALQQPIRLNWAQVFNQGTVEAITVNLVPLFSAGKTDNKQEAFGIATLFMENNRGTDQKILKKQIIDLNALKANSPFPAFDKLCIAVLSWILNASYSTTAAAISFEKLLEQKITAQALSDILYALNHTEDNEGDTAPFSYEQIVQFIRSLFVVNIIDPNTDHKEALLNNEVVAEKAEAKDLFLTIFPMIPQLFLSNSANDVVIDFSSFNGVNKEYLKVVNELIRQFSPGTSETDDYLEDLSVLESIATHLFKDYFSLIGKSLLQTASDVMEVYTYTIPEQKNSLADIASNFLTTPLALVNSNKTQEGLLKPEQSIIISGTQYAMEPQDTFAGISKKHDYVNHGEEWAKEFTTLNLKAPLFIPMSEILLPGNVFYRVLPEETLEIIASKNGLEPEQTREILLLNFDRPVLSALILVQIPAFQTKVPENATFLSIVTAYNIQLLDFAAANEDNTVLLIPGSLLTIEKVKSLSIAALLNAVYQKDFFTGAGGNASRFTLHGLRLPEVVADGLPGNELSGLYVLSGQQFTLPPIEDVSTFDYTFTLSKERPSLNADPLPWVTFNGIAAKPDEVTGLAYTLLPEEKEMAQQFQQIGLNPSISTGPKPLQLYRDQEKTFAFANPLKWAQQGNTTGSSIWNFSRSLNAVLAAQPEIGMKLATQDRPGGQRSIKDLASDSYSYSTFLPLSIRKSAAASAISKCTFEVFGTDATGIDLLTALLQDDQKDIQPDQLSILFSPSPAQDEVKVLNSFNSADLLLLLINTNLSTETNPKLKARSLARQKISNTPVKIMIERIWKSSLVRTGGYYLYLETGDGNTLPDNIFSSNGEAELYVMITYKRAKGISANLLRTYMNTVVTTTPVNPDQELLFGSWKVDLDHVAHDQLVMEGKLDRNAILKPGNAGFELSRKNPENLYQNTKHTAGTIDYSYELEQQYNLLNFRTLDNTDFKAIRSLLPVSPQDDASKTPATKSTPSDELWQYTKALPLTHLYKATTKDNAKDSTVRPPTSLSPYIGLTKTLQLEFNWQDNYGNIFDTSIPALSYKVLYFDQIVPLSAWPALNMDYAFESFEASTHNFGLYLEFYPGDQYSWNPESPDAANDKERVLLRAHADLEQYTAIYYQLAEADFSASFRTTADPDQVYPETAAAQQVFKNGLMDYLDAALQWINQFIADPDRYNQFEGSGQERYRYPYTYATAINVTNPKDIFALSVAVHFSRSEDNIDPQFILSEQPKVFVAGVQSIACPVKPRLKGFKAESASQSQNNSELLMLTAFARHFETVFSKEQLKVGASYVSETESSVTGAKEEELWVVRFKELKSEQKGIGFDIRFGDSICYAPQPLSNFLVTLPDTPVYPFAHYTDKPEDTPVLKNFNDVDTEIWASQFLSALEFVLSPEMSLPINMIDHLKGHEETSGILSRLLKAKKTLADAISKQTIPVLAYEQVPEAGKQVAQEKIRQQLLINLVRAYAINAVIQYPAQIASPYPDGDQPIAPNLYGKPYVATAEGAAAQDNYSFSTGKVPLRKLDSDVQGADTSYLTYTFSTQNAGLESNLALPVDYQISHLEYNITKLNATNLPGYSPDLKDYELSKWLTFIIPLTAQNGTGKTETYIPVPIRQYPSLPAFERQGFVNDNSNKDISIKDSKYSDFLFNYTLQAFTAQDTYHFEVYFNAKQADWQQLEQQKNLSQKQKDLFMVLAQFESVRTGFTDFLSAELPKVQAADKPEDLNPLIIVLNNYAVLVNEVADKWLKLYSQDRLLAFRVPAVEVVKVTFATRERDSDPGAGSGLFELVLNNWSATANGQAVSYIQLPQVALKGYVAELCPTKEAGTLVFRYYKMEDGKKVYLSFKEGILIKERSVCFKELSVLQVQNGWAGMYVKRNADLSGAQKPLNTAPEFIYSTPVRRFSNPVTPSRKVNTELPLPALAPQAATLMDYLKFLMGELLATQSGAVNPVMLKILVNYTYCLQDIPVQLPVVLIPPTIFDETDVAGTGTAITTLNQVILDWFSSNNPARDNGLLHFDVTFYSSIDAANSLPLLGLENISLKVADVSDLLNGK